MSEIIPLIVAHDTVVHVTLATRLPVAALAAAVAMLSYFAIVHNVLDARIAAPMFGIISAAALQPGVEYLERTDRRVPQRVGAALCVLTIALFVSPQAGWLCGMVLSAVVLPPRAAALLLVTGGGVALAQELTGVSNPMVYAALVAAGSWLLTLVAEWALPPIKDNGRAPRSKSKAAKK